MATQGVLHFATKDFEVKKNGVFSVPASKLILLDGFNDREDYGDVNQDNKLTLVEIEEFFIGEIAK